jgi:hypothetical protein
MNYTFSQSLVLMIIIGEIQHLPETELHRAILTDPAVAIHTTLLEGGVAPFDLAATRILDTLNDIAASLERCQKKGLSSAGSTIENR